MPTVTAADEALSSCSQNAAYSADIMAAQVRKREDPGRDRKPGDRGCRARAFRIGNLPNARLREGCVSFTSGHLASPRPGPRANHEVKVAHDGSAAVETFAAFRPHVVLLDIGMPGLSGYEVARKMREQEQQSDVTLIAITRWAGERQAARTRCRVRPSPDKAL